MEASAPPVESFSDSATGVYKVDYTIYIQQAADNELWVYCNKGHTLTEAIEKYGDWSKLLTLGLNANFLTRKRWFDVETLVKKLGVQADDLWYSARTAINQKQFEDLDITFKEMELLGVTGNHLCRLLTPEMFCNLVQGFHITLQKWVDHFELSKEDLFELNLHKSHFMERLHWTSHDLQKTLHMSSEDLYQKYDMGVFAIKLSDDLEFASDGIDLQL